MTMSMHWITWDWLLKSRTLGTMHFPKKHTIANIFDRLLNARKDSGVWPTDAKSRIPESGETLGCEKLAYFRMELSMNILVLTSDCKVMCQREQKKTILGLESFCMSLSKHNYAISSEMSLHTEVYGSLGGVGLQVLQEQGFMDGVQEGSVGNATSGG